MINENGKTYVVWDTHYKDIFQKIKPLLDSGYKCCIFTKDSFNPPADLHQNLKIIRVSDQKTENTIPLRPEYIMRDFEDFVNANKDKAVIVFDVFDNLLQSGSTDFTTAYTLLNQMIDMTAMNNNILFVPISSKSLDEKEKCLIMRSGMNVINVGDEKKPSRNRFFRRKKG